MTRAQASSFDPSSPDGMRASSRGGGSTARRFASRVDGRHTSLGHAATTTKTTTQTTTRGAFASSSSSSSSSALVADARGRRAVSRCAVRRVDAGREEPKILLARRRGSTTTTTTTTTTTDAHRPTDHRARAVSLFETPVATTATTTTATTTATRRDVCSRSRSRARETRRATDVGDTRATALTHTGEPPVDHHATTETTTDDTARHRHRHHHRRLRRDASPAAARARPPPTPDAATTTSDAKAALREERDALRSAYELVVAERDDARAIRERARNAERDAARRLEASRLRHDARARHLRRAIDVIEHLRHGRARAGDVDDFLDACRRDFSSASDDE